MRLLELFALCTDGPELAFDRFPFGAPLQLQTGGTLKARHTHLDSGKRSMSSPTAFTTLGCQAGSMPACTGSRTGRGRVWFDAQRLLPRKMVQSGCCGAKIQTGDQLEEAEC